jgi:chromosome partitioning protein
MHTIALVSQKGGTGKSTLAIGLAIAAMQDGHKVCLLEADPQGTLSNWRSRRAQAEPAVEQLQDGIEFAHRVPFLERCGVTLTIIDTPAGQTEVGTAAIAVADLTLIPARPSPADIEAAAPTLALVRASDKPFAFVLNQTPVRSFRVANAAGALSETAIALNASGVLALPYIVLRNDQQDALGAGLAVTEYALHGKSADEIRSLWQWVSSRLAAADETRADRFAIAAPANEQADLRTAG